MRKSLMRWLACAGAVAVAGALAAGPGLASASVSVPGVTPSGSASGAYVPPDHDLYYGDTGAAVKSVQRRLNQLHYYAGPVDGVFGPDLEWAVWAFKEVQGLPMPDSAGGDLYGPNSTITAAFRHDLVDPKLPYVFVPKGGAERVEINLHRQILVLYKNNRVYLILDVSTGGGYWFLPNGAWCAPGTANCSQAVTLDGNFHAEYFVSGWDTVPLGEMYNPVFFDLAAGQAMHGGDIVPFYPDSHGCVRLQLDAEDWFHTLLTVGGKDATPVYVRGTAPYAPSITGWQ
jgi:hypothetical protein